MCFGSGRVWQIRQNRGPLQRVVRDLYPRSAVSPVFEWRLGRIYAGRTCKKLSINGATFRGPSFFNKILHVFYILLALFVVPILYKPKCHFFRAWKCRVNTCQFLQIKRLYVDPDTPQILFRPQPFLDCLQPGI